MRSIGGWFVVAKNKNKGKIRVPLLRAPKDRRVWYYTWYRDGKEMRRGIWYMRKEKAIVMVREG